MLSGYSSPPGRPDSHRGVIPGRNRRPTAGRSRWFPYRAVGRVARIPSRSLVAGRESITSCRAMDRTRCHAGHRRYPPISRPTTGAINSISRYEFLASRGNEADEVGGHEWVSFRQISAQPNGFERSRTPIRRIRRDGRRADGHGLPDGLDRPRTPDLGPDYRPEIQDTALLPARRRHAAE